MNQESLSLANVSEKSESRPVLKLYLSHPTPSRHKIREWEIEFEKKNPNIVLVNPFYDNPENREDIGALDEGRPYIEEEDYAERVVERDLRFLGQQHGILFVASKEVSIGAPMELLKAFDSGKYPRIAICLDDLHNHPWARYHATHIYRSFEEFEKNAEKIYLDFLKNIG